ncbi:DUF1330 domain-containing protein [Diaphorobacter aerolatus]|uniref:DUF1330 domain-containing protein n=1 Tax=Diaphorobacter aerolatus TaxID=1288495 RepID=A0A7H0GK76_9BURK|nr:DUF1330 domain-containing protein [Diaphorobacter aerolatus]QNP48692.1 DUF1330 domain-containing protein [Diaphorobacter aerolatus]
MTAYAVGLLNDLKVGPDIVRYLEHIDASLTPYGGAFLVHGTRPQMKEGVFTGDCIIISFPTMKLAQDWYDSEDYAALIPLRAANAQSTIFLLEGVESGYRAASLLDKLKMT